MGRINSSQGKESNSLLRSGSTRSGNVHAGRGYVDTRASENLRRWNNSSRAHAEHHFSIDPNSFNYQEGYADGRRAAERRPAEHGSPSDGYGINQKAEERRLTKGCLFWLVLDILALIGLGAIIFCL